jgi:hypothetical protein
MSATIDVAIDTAVRVVAGTAGGVEVGARPAPAFIRGIAGPLPDGERILWEGAPLRASVTRHAFHARKVAVYFAGLVVFRLMMTGITGLGTFAGWRPVLILIGLGLAGVAVSELLAALSARTTWYAITDRRVVLRSGIVLSGVLNVPLRAITGAAAKLYADGSGDLAIMLGSDVRIAYLRLWPYVRAWRITRPQPALRGLADVHQTGALLRAALVAVSGVDGAAVRAGGNGDVTDTGRGETGTTSSDGRGGVRQPRSGSAVAA